MRYLALALAVFLLTGCPATTQSRPDQVSFDRGVFALTYADFTSTARVKCAKDEFDKKEPTAACISFKVMDETVRQAIIDAPKRAAAEGGSGFDLSSLGPLLLKLAPLAAMAAS
jgi:hypothetical protein